MKRERWRDWAVILQSVSDETGVSVDDIKGRSRRRRIVRARHAAMYLMNVDASLSSVKIGELLGHREHATVLKGVKRVQDGLSGADTGMGRIVRNSRARAAI